MDNAEKFIKAFSGYLVGRQQSNGEWRAFCPIHEDPSRSKSSSASLNFETGLWHCASASCGDGGSIRELYRVCRAQGKIGSVNSRSNVVNIKTKKPVDEPDKALPDEAQIKYWTKMLLSKSNALRIMTDERGLTKNTIRKFQIGWDGQRFTIPIRDEEGKLVNVRRYKPNAKKH